LVTIQPAASTMKPGADGLRLLRRTLRLHLGHALLAEALGEALHELFHLLLLAGAVGHLDVVVVGRAGLHGHGDIDDRRGHLGGEVGEVLHARHDGRSGGDRRRRGEQRGDQHRRRQRRRQRQGGENGLGLRHKNNLLRGALAKEIWDLAHGDRMAASLNVCIVGIVAFGLEWRQMGPQPDVRT
jgi:hypothetical protein